MVNRVHLLNLNPLMDGLGESDSGIRVVVHRVVGLQEDVSEDGGVLADEAEISGVDTNNAPDPSE